MTGRSWGRAQCQGCESRDAESGVVQGVLDQGAVALAGCFEMVLIRQDRPAEGQEAGLETARQGCPEVPVVLASGESQERKVSLADPKMCATS